MVTVHVDTKYVNCSLCRKPRFLGVGPNFQDFNGRKQQAVKTVILFRVHELGLSFIWGEILNIVMHSRDAFHYYKT